jgi:hypothetical protein
MRAPVQSLDPLLRVEGEWVPRVPVYLDSDSEQYVGNVAKEGMRTHWRRKERCFHPIIPHLCQAVRLV